MNKESLKDWAKRNDISYSSAYRRFRKNEIEGAYKEGGEIFIGKNPERTAKTESPALKGKYEVLAANIDSGTRRTRAANSVREGIYENIDSLFSPYLNSQNVSPYGKNNSILTPSQCIDLCQKAYYGISTVRKVVNILSAFCVSDIQLVGGTDKSRDFFKTYFKLIKLKSLQKKVFLEYWRSCNVFIYKIYGKLKKSDVRNLSKKYESFAAKDTAKIPISYSIINPVDVIHDGSIFYGSARYSKRLNTYEIARLKERRTETDQIIYNSLDPKVKKLIDNHRDTGINEAQILLDLPEKHLSSIFHNRQDYESFAVPFIYPVLDDLDHKIQLKNIDKAIANTCQQAVLHVAIGYESKDGEYVYSNEVAAKIQEIFENESVGKTLITDFSAKVNFILPQIADILSPEKYKIINEDIRDGLMDIIFGGEGEKFSNLNTKVKVFIEQIKKAREDFINDFLIPEMEMIADEFGLQNIPEPKFEEIDIEDNINFYRVVTRLAELNILTPEELFNAFETGRIPTAEESKLAQEKFKKLRDDGLYVPTPQQLKADTDALSAEGGRPAGTTAPQTTKTVSPVGTSTAGTIPFKDVVKSHVDLNKAVTEFLKKKYKVKAAFNDKQKLLVKSIVNDIIKNAPKNKWIDSIESVFAGTYGKNAEQIEEIRKISEVTGLSEDSAALIYHYNEE